MQNFQNREVQAAQTQNGRKSSMHTFRIMRCMLLRLEKDRSQPCKLFRIIRCMMLRLERRRLNASPTRSHHVPQYKHHQPEGATFPRGLITSLNTPLSRADAAPTRRHQVPERTQHQPEYTMFPSGIITSLKSPRSRTDAAPTRTHNVPERAHHQPEDTMFPSGLHSIAHRPSPDECRYLCLFQAFFFHTYNFPTTSLL